MTVETQWTRMWEVFHAALEREDSARQSFLDEACGEDAALRARLDSLLAAHTRAERTMGPAASERRDARASIFAEIVDGRANEVLHPDEAPPEALPHRLGRFTILNVLGAGGMGVVYRAQEDFPRRVVALKVLRHGLASRTMLRRFEQEAQLLARLTHPGIARVYEAGSFADGAPGRPGESAARPYLAMELVEGPPLVDHARQHQLTLKQRLELMIEICDAVHDAHLKGVIHRDLKPGNILVNSDGRPKVLDFGIARATDQDVQTATLQTRAGQIVGTVPYMSPEQLTGDVAGLDLRSDVYSLGVILYELLAERLPHDLNGLSLTDTIMRVTRSEPRRLGAVNVACRGELEVIVAKAMERDRQRRCQSAAALADDLRAHLEHRPIQARRAGAILRLRKWARRRPASAAALTMGLAAVIVLAALLTAQRAQTARLRETQTRQALATAELAVQNYARRAQDIQSIRAELLILQDRLFRYISEDEGDRLERRQQELQRGLQEHQGRFYEALDRLTEAERLSAPAEAVQQWRARLHMARHREADAIGERFDRTLHLDLARQHDPSGEIEREFTQRHRVSFVTEPPGADVHVFRLVEQTSLSAAAGEGEPRLVPAPLQPVELPVLPGTWALRVVRGVEGALQPDDLILKIADHPIRASMIAANDAGEIHRLDRLVAIDDNRIVDRWSLQRHGSVTQIESGEAPLHRYEFERCGERMIFAAASLRELGVEVLAPAELAERGHTPALVWREGRAETIALPPGLMVRVTSRPLFLGTQTSLGRTPLTDLELVSGAYQIVYQLDGYETLRLPLTLPAHAAPVAAIELQALGATPEGFVRIPRVSEADTNAYWIMEHEVTAAEYLEFLNDPAVLKQIDEASTVMLVPRMAGEPVFERGRGAVTGSGGQFMLPSSWDPSWPVMYVSWHDARAYAAWRTARNRATGRIDVYFDLPTYHEWTSAWGAAGRLNYPWGDLFRTRWTSNNFARPEPLPEPVMSFPIDETLFGVYDMSGSASEWLNAYWFRARGLLGMAGGSWGHGGQMSQNMFALHGANGISPDRTMGTTGFRLVMRRGDGPPSPDEVPDVYHNEAPSNRD